MHGGEHREIGDGGWLMMQPQIFREDKLGLFPVHISCGVLSTDFDGTLLSVKATVSRVYPQNDNGKSDLLIIDRTMSNKVLLLRSNMPFLCGVPGGVSRGTIPWLFR